MTKLLARYIKFLRSILKGLLPFALLSCLVVPLFGYLVRWHPADEALSRYRNETAVMVGGNYRSLSTTSDRGEMTSSVYRERIYILLPSIFSEPKTVTVSQRNDEPYRVSENPSGVFHMLIMYGLIVFGVWRFWLRRPAKP
jgi:hypothetical protein